MVTTDSPIAISLVAEPQVISEGVTSLLASSEQFAVGEWDENAGPQTLVDVALFDPYGPEAHSRQGLRLLDDDRCDRVVAYSWDVAEDKVQRMLHAGAHGYLSKSLDAEQLSAALVRLHAGERVVERGATLDEDSVDDWPGRDIGLTSREVEVIWLITCGVTNEDIAKAFFLSINSVKSYIRSAYRKMDVDRRSQAVMWGARNGVLQHFGRAVPPSRAA